GKKMFLPSMARCKWSAQALLKGS
ncbi:hypothetical protein D046_0921B, partial [Vibrio parahaemolyticus V-223/04]